MKKTIQTFIKILGASLFAVLLLAGCDNGIVNKFDNADGIVTVTVAADDSRTILPAGINMSSFERIELEFTNNSGASIIGNIVKPNTSTTVNLVGGVWNINAKGFVKINNIEYEAARGNASVNASSQSNVNINLETGIFAGNPGVFNYNIVFPESAVLTEAALNLKSLDNIYGYAVETVNENINLMAARAGSITVLPGYYLLSIAARTSDTMAVWNEIVHIYSGQETTASHTFAASDFTGLITLSGVVYGGELDGKKIESAVVGVYGDPSYIGRITSFELANFTKMTASPYYYQKEWTIQVPNSFAGKTLYFRLEETLRGTDGLTNYKWDSEVSNITAGKNDIKINGSYTWSEWVDSSLPNSLSYTFEADGTIKATTTQYAANQGDHQLSFQYPMEINKRYVFEYEAWVDGGTRDIQVHYVSTWPWNTTYRVETINLTTDRKSFTFISDFAVDSKTRPLLILLCGSSTVTGSFNIKMKSIKTTDEYAPPDPAEGRWTAEAVAEGIKFVINLKDMPDAFRNSGDLVIFNETTESHFAVFNSKLTAIDTYEVIYPFVEAGKSYTFRLGTWDYPITTVKQTVTAAGGRGELLYTNQDQLALIKTGNNIQITPAPSVPAYFKEGKYRYEFATGTSWSDPLATWKGVMEVPNANPVNLMSSEYILWFTPAQFFGELAGRTSFAGVFYIFDYEDPDIYPTGSPTGYFRTKTISSTSFVYPNVFPGLLTAETDSEGVKLTVRKDQIPQGAEAIQFRQGDWNARLYIHNSWWNSPSEKFYEGDVISIVYPFVVPGQSYDFYISFEGTGTGAEASAVAGAGGLGEMIIPNRDNIGLLYSSGTQTVSVSGPLAAPVIAESPKISRKFWQWQFYTGENWNFCEWRGQIQQDDPIVSLNLNLLDSETAIRVSGQTGFINPSYNIIYDGNDFSAGFGASPPFVYPTVGTGGTTGATINGSTLSINSAQIITVDNNSFSPKYDNYDGSNFSVYGNNNQGTGSVTDGKLTFNIDVPNTLYSINDVIQSLFSGTTASASPNVNCYVLMINSDDDSIFREKTSISGDSSNWSATMEYVRYVYVDAAVIITGQANTVADGNFTYNFSEFSIGLTTGWNAIYTKYVGSGNAAGGAYNVTFSLDNPSNLFWVYRD